MKLFLVTAFFACALPAQVIHGPVVDANTFPPISDPTQIFSYDANSNLQYICSATAQQPSFSWTRSTSTLTSIVVLSNVGTVTTSAAHGLAVGNLSTASGATVASTLNGTYYIQTVPSPTTYTITTSGVANGTYTESTLAVASTAPRSSAAIWVIEKLSYNASNLLSMKQWASGSPNSYTFVCDNRAVTTGATKITYR